RGLNFIFQLQLIKETGSLFVNKDIVLLVCIML
ncbi:hypothetical protein Q604_UNBC14993G0001, partial [human gut metagenome]